MKILIMAGGKGTRLWPLSRTQKPKQFQKLISEKTVLQETVQRMLPLGKWSDIYVSTSVAYFDEVKRELPKVPKENIIAEPVNRERASSIALSCAFFTKRCPSETIVALPADHLIKKANILLSIIKKANAVLEKYPDYLITVGIKPRTVDTGLGYIKRGKKFARQNNYLFFKTEKFVEKPDFKTAQRFIKNGNYFWNSGIYLFKAPSLLERYKKFVPDSYKHIQKLIKAIDASRYKEILENQYPEMDPVSFECSIVENDNKILMVPADIEWNDIGSWAALKDLLIKHNHKSYAKASHLDVNSQNLLVYGSPGKLIATVGLKDLIIVDTPDVILICDESHSQEIKEVVKMLEETEGKKHL